MYETRIFQHHAPSRIFEAISSAVAEPKFSPDSKLLYVQTERANDLHAGVVSLFYLSEDEITPCVFEIPQQVYRLEDIE